MTPTTTSTIASTSVAETTNVVEQSNDEEQSNDDNAQHDVPSASNTPLIVGGVLGGVCCGVLFVFALMMAVRLRQRKQLIYEKTNETKLAESPSTTAPSSHYQPVKIEAATYQPVPSSSDGNVSHYSPLQMKEEESSYVVLPT